PTAVGIFNVHATVTDAANLTGQLDIAFTISKKAVTVSGLTVFNKNYDGTTAASLNAANVVLAGVYAPDIANVALNISGATATFADPNVGVGKPVIVAGLALSGSAAANYSLTAPTVVGNIVGQAATVVISNVNRVYDGQPKPV